MNWATAHSCSSSTRHRLPAHIAAAEGEQVHDRHDGPEHVRPVCQRTARRRAVLPLHQVTCAPGTHDAARRERRGSGRERGTETPARGAPRGLPSRNRCQPAAAASTCPSPSPLESMYVGMVPASARPCWRTAALECRRLFRAGLEFATFRGSRVPRRSARQVPVAAPRLRGRPPRRHCAQVGPELRGMAATVVSAPSRGAGAGAVAAVVGDGECRAPVGARAVKTLGPAACWRGYQRRGSS